MAMEISSGFFAENLFLLSVKGFEQLQTGFINLFPLYFPQLFVLLLAVNHTLFPLGERSVSNRAVFQDFIFLVFRLESDACTASAVGTEWG